MSNDSNFELDTFGEVRKKKGRRKEGKRIGEEKRDRINGEPKRSSGRRGRRNGGE